MKKFRAILLAAGLGTRLRPITENTPKCMVQVAKKPLLGYWINYLDSINCESVLINTHYLADQVVKYVDEISNVRMKIELVHERELLGTAATLIKNSSFFDDYTGLFIHADNFSEAKLDQFLNAHHNRQTDCLLTMLTFKTDNPKNSGIIIKDKENIMKEFHEKKEHIKGNCANAAIYAFENNFLQWLKVNCPDARDFSLDVLPKLLNKVQTFHTNDLFVDIGNPKSLSYVNDLISKKGI